MKRLALLLLVACGPPSGGGEVPVKATCTTQLPASVITPVAPLPMTIAASTIPVELQIPFSKVSSELEGRVPRRVAEEKDHDIGIAGRLEYTADRGAFVARMQGESIAVETTISIHAKACAKGTCYAGCDPEARAVATLPLRLDANYKFRPSTVRVDVTKGCSVRMGFVTVDVTPMLRDELNKAARQLSATVDKKLPDLKPEATRLWDELGMTRALPLGACAVISPSEIVQGAPSGDASAAKLRFALIAQPELHVRCNDAKGTSVALPALRDGTTEGDAHLAVVMPPEALSLDGVTAEKNRIVSARGTPGAIEATVSGEVCGTLGFGANSAAWLDASHVHLSGVTGDPSVAALATAIEKAPIAVPFGPDQLATSVPALASAASDNQVDVSAAILEAKPDTAGVRGTEIVAVERVRGVLTLRAK